MSTAVHLEGAMRPASGHGARAALGRWLRVPLAVVRLARATWRGTLLGFVIAALGACALSGSGLFLGAGMAVDRLVGGAVAGLWFLALWGVVRGARWLFGAVTGRFLARRQARRHVRGLAALDHWLRHPDRTDGLAIALVLFAATFAVVPPAMALAPNNAYLPAMVAAAVVGGLTGLAMALWPAGDVGDGAVRALRLSAAWVAGFVAFALVASGLTFAAWPGPGTIATTQPPLVAQLTSDLPDPGQPGPYHVSRTSYGSGTDPRRPAFGPDTPIRTPTVDASHAIDPIAWPGDPYARWLLGAGLDRLPLNALVWVPEGNGPFPLVLVVHGNHAMGDASEAGYAYLGEHLASRGFVTASIDASMLNGNLFGDLHGAEMPVRAWVLLQHLGLWRDWTADPSSPFHGLVDMGRVALIGHSRGGEAAAVAASMASASPSSYPTLQPFPSGLVVKAVVAIAPCDGQIEGAGHGPNRLGGIDYLTIQGGLDADMAWWSSLRQLARTEVAGSDDIKAGIWIRRANHGRFSSTWNLGDAGLQGEWLLDQASLLAPDEQQDVAKTVIAGFLEASLQGRDGYRSMFAVPALGREWLPEDAYVTRLVEGSTAMLADFEPGAAAASSLEPDATTRVFKQELMTRATGVGQLDRVAKVLWTGRDGSVSLAVPAGAVVNATSGLRFAIATASLDPAEAVPAVTVELVDAAGRVAAVPLEGYGGVFPPMPMTPWKSREVAGFAQFGAGVELDAETHLQTYALPMSAFMAAEPDFDPASLDLVRFRFEGPDRGAVFLDEIGIDPS